MSDYEKFLECHRLYELASNARDNGQWEKAWAYEARAEALDSPTD